MIHTHPHGWGDGMKLNSKCPKSLTQSNRFYFSSIYVSMFSNFSIMHMYFYYNKEKQLCLERKIKHMKTCCNTYFTNVSYYYVLVASIDSTLMVYPGITTLYIHMKFKMA